MSDKTPDPMRAHIDAMQRRIAAKLDAALCGFPRPATEWKVSGTLTSPLTAAALMAAIEPLLEAAREPQLIRIIVREDIPGGEIRKYPLDGGDFEYHLGTDAWFKLDAQAEHPREPLWPPTSVLAFAGAPVIFVRNESEIPEWHRRIR